MNSKTFIALSMALVLTGCASSAIEEISSASPLAFVQRTSDPAELPSTEEKGNAEEESNPLEVSLQKATQGPDCLGPDVNDIGQGIADTYEESSFEEVMIWFCNGAEFEDILLALQSERQSEASAEEMLIMLAEGFTWDEIWLLIGIIE